MALRAAGGARLLQAYLVFEVVWEQDQESGAVKVDEVAVVDEVELPLFSKEIYRAALHARAPASIRVKYWGCVTW